VDDPHLGYITKLTPPPPPPTQKKPIGVHAPVGSQKHKRMLNFLKLSYAIYSQIWLNLLMDDHHFCYITKEHSQVYEREREHMKAWGKRMMKCRT